MSGGGLRRPAGEKTPAARRTEDGRRASANEPPAPKSRNPASGPEAGGRARTPGPRDEPERRRAGEPERGHGRPNEPRGRAKDGEGKAKDGAATAAMDGRPGAK